MVFSCQNIGWDHVGKKSNLFMALRPPNGIVVHTPRYT